MKKLHILLCRIGWHGWSNWQTEENMSYGGAHWKIVQTCYCLYCKKMKHSVKLLMAYLLLTLFSTLNTLGHDEFVASVLIAEAGGERDSRAMPAILEVIQNRSKQRNKDIYNIIKQKHQFESVTNKTDKEIINKAKKHPKYLTALNIVKVNKNNNYTRAANHFLTKKLFETKPPKWAMKDKVTVIIENHVFLKL